jgi:hypothetical protein
LWAWAQTSSTYVVDGQRLESGKLNGGTYSVESARSINGRAAPRQRVEERVIESTADTKVIERVTRRFDSNGNPGQTEKVRISERKNPDGSLATETVTWWADVNGRLQVFERAKGVSRPTQGGTNSEVIVERPTLNGGFETLEKRTTTERKSGQTVEQDTITWRRDASGRFSEAARQTTARTEKDGQVTENVARYETGAAGRLELASQAVSRSVKNADGSERTETDIYRAAVPGRSTSSTPRLIEQEVVERRPGAPGTVVETVSVRNPAPDGAKPAGAYRKISERVCTGECK